VLIEQQLKFTYK